MGDDGNLAGDAAAWLRKQAETDLEAAKAATPGPWEFEGDDPTDDELFSTAGDDRMQTVAWTRDRQAANGRHMEAHDPQAETARAESVLAVLDLYEQTRAIAARAPSRPSLGTPLDHVIAENRARDWMDAQREMAVLGSVIELLASGYRHRAGYREEWKP